MTAKQRLSSLCTWPNFSRDNFACDTRSCDVIFEVGSRSPSVSAITGKEYLKIFHWWKIRGIAMWLSEQSVWQAAGNPVGKKGVCMYVCSLWKRVWNSKWSSDIVCFILKTKVSDISQPCSAVWSDHLDRSNRHLVIYVGSLWHRI